MFSHRKYNNSKYKSIFIKIIKFIFIILLFTYIAQTFFAHRNGTFSPDYPKINLTYILEKSTLTPDDYETIFMQSGLGKTSVNYLIKNDDDYIETIKQYQAYFFEPKRVKCEPLLSIFTREDILVNEISEEMFIPFVNIEPGDVIVTTSTHSMGWRHGHSGLYLGKDRTLECTVLGSNSVISKLSDWQRYSNFAVLRVKYSTYSYRTSVAGYAYNNLFDIPYRLTSGLWGQKYTDPTAPYFGLHCGYLVWYAWQANGIDLDSDQGKIVTPNDLLYSNELEVVQLYGIDPSLFID